MAKLLKKILLSAVVLCTFVGAAIFAACGEEKCDYSITVSCAELTQEQLDTLGVKLVSSDGKAAEEKKLQNGRADFSLAPATYTVELSGDLLENFTYSAATVTKEKPNATVTLSPKASATVTYTVQVTGAEGVSVKLLKEDGTDATEAKTLVNGSVSFDLAPATYKVKLLGDALENYAYTEPTLTADSPSATVVLSPKPAAKIFYTVTVTCESAPSILAEITVKVFPVGSETAAAAQTLNSGSARFYLAPDNYTVALSDTRNMLADFAYEDVTLTAESPSATIALTPKEKEPDGSEDNPFVLTTLAGEYSFTPQKIENSVGSETFYDYTSVYYIYTPAAEETYTFTTSINYLELIIEDENGKTVLDNISGDDRFYRAFTLSAGKQYTMQAMPDAGNSPYREGDTLTWKIQSGEQPRPDVTFTVTVTCDDEALLAKLKVGLYQADGSLAQEKELVNGSATFTLPPATYTVKLSGEGLGEYNYSEKTLSQSSPTAEIKLTKKTEAKQFLSGKGTESAPYIVDPLTGNYSVPTDGGEFVYIKYVSAAAGKYTLTADSDDFFMIMTQGSRTLVTAYGTAIVKTFDVVAGDVKMEVKNDAGNNAPVGFTITRADGSFDPEKGPSAPDTPDLTPFLGTWADGNGRSLLVTVSAVVYTEQGQTYNAQVVSAESGLLKFDFQKGAETMHYAVRVSGTALELLDCGTDGNGSSVLSTLTQGGGQGGGQGEGEVGSEQNPIVWNTILGTHEVDLPAGDDNGQPRLYCAYTAQRSGIYSLSYTLNGKAFSDLNLIVYYLEGNRQHTVAAWNTSDQAYAFPLTANNRYIFRLSDGSASGAGGKLSLTVTEATLSFPTAYSGTWVDANDPTYTVSVDTTATAVTVNGQAVTGLTLAPFNGGYEFVWDGKNCNISIGKTQNGVYESVMLFSMGGEGIPLYHPGSVPKIEYGTEEHPKPITQSEIVKDWSDSLSSGEFYWTVTATETKVYTLTTTIEHLFISITDTQTTRIILNWNDSETVKSGVFELTAGHTYLLNYTDSSSDGMRFKAISFRIAEGGSLERAALPQELLGIEWVDEQNSRNNLSFTQTEATATILYLGSLPYNYVGYIKSVQTTATGFVITFVSEKKGTAGMTCTLTFDRAAMTMQFVSGNVTCTFKAKTNS